MVNLGDKKLFLLDMDGTIYLGNKLFDGTTDFLNNVLTHGGRYVFVTNNSSKSVDAYVEKLRGIGIESTAEDFLTSADVTAVYLKEKKYRKIYVLGTKSLISQLSGAALPVTDALCDDIDCLCMGFDTELTFKKLEDACKILGRGVDYIATNPDLVCPTEYGYVPDCGSVSEMLYNATKRRPIFIGKPSPQMPLAAMKKFGCTKEETVVVGDRLYTDIACGVNAGVDTVFVLSGEGTLADAEKSEAKPTYIYDNIRAMTDDIF